MPVLQIEGGASRCDCRHTRAFELTNSLASTHLPPLFMAPLLVRQEISIPLPKCR